MYNCAVFCSSLANLKLKLLEYFWNNAEVFMLLWIEMFKRKIWQGKFSAME
jgi:hypothetical protein